MYAPVQLPDAGLALYDPAGHALVQTRRHGQVTRGLISICIREDCVIVNVGEESIDGYAPVQAAAPAAA